jgi:hypothetical protein
LEAEGASFAASTSVEKKPGAFAHARRRSTRAPLGGYGSRLWRNV